MKKKCVKSMQGNLRLQLNQAATHLNVRLPDGQTLAVPTDRLYDLALSVVATGTLWRVQFNRAGKYRLARILRHAMTPDEVLYHSAGWTVVAVSVRLRERWAEDDSAYVDNAFLATRRATRNLFRSLPDEPTFDGRISFSTGATRREDAAAIRASGRQWSLSDIVAELHRVS